MFKYICIGLNLITMLFQLTYKSEAAPNLKVEDLQNILNTSRSFNSSENITGCLIYTTKIFVQILEGEKTVVQKLYESIVKDKRHFNVTLIHEGAAVQRKFPKWAMAYLNPNDATEGPKSDEVMLSLQKMYGSSQGPAFDLDRFWYNVSALLADAGYYPN